MKNKVIKGCLLMVFSGSLCAANMTYEEAMKLRDPATVYNNSKSITSSQSQASWDRYEQIADQNSSGNSGLVKRSYKVLWEAPNKNGLNHGNIKLSQSFRDFDEILVIGSNDGGSYMQHYRFTPTEYDLAVNMRGGTATLYERDSVSWNGKFTSNTYFKTTHENSTLHAIYGVILTSGSGTGGGSSGICSAGDKQTKKISCVTGRTLVQGVSQRTCTSGSVWTSWRVQSAPECVANGQNPNSSKDNTHEYKNSN